MYEKQQPETSIKYNSNCIMFINQHSSINLANEKKNHTKNLNHLFGCAEFNMKQDCEKVTVALEILLFCFNDHGITFGGS